LGVRVSAADKLVEEGEMKLAVAVVRRLDRARTALLEQQQDLAVACFHCAAALSEIADDAKTEDLIVKLSGKDHIIDVQRRFEDSLGLRMQMPALP